MGDAGTQERPTGCRAYPWQFFALALGLTWLFWIPTVRLPVTTPAWLIFLLHAFGGLMPLLAALLLSRQHRPQEQHDYSQRITDFTRICGRWYAVILLMMPGLTGLSVVGDMALGGRGAALEAAARLVEHPLAVVPFAVFLLLFGPVPEELAWRGYALEQLQQRCNGLISSVMLGGLWTVWHVPLFFLTGSSCRSRPLRAR